MSDSVRKVLVGALVGALIVGFAWHAASERSRRAPAMTGGPPPGAAQAGAPRTGDSGRPPGAGPQGGAAVGGGGGPPLPVRALPARNERLSLEIEALGTARANESIEVTSKVSNVVTAVRFTEGQQVRKGTVLVELDSEQARADLAVAEAALKESASQYRRSRELYETRVLSQSQIEQIEATYDANRARVASAKARLSDTMVRAPFDGRVGLRRISVGSLVAPGTVITTLDDTSRIKLDFTVPETALGALRPGLTLTAASAAFPDQRFEGTVASVDSRVDPTTRAVMVRALLPNGAGLLKPGMFLTVRLERGAADVLTVPEESLLPEQGDMFVWVVADGQASKRQVQIGERRVGSVQVLSGLEPGELVVTEGTQRLREGAAVRLLDPPALKAGGAANGGTEGGPSQ
jgi:membrane fusion protein (multidrug efflux system)